MHRVEARGSRTGTNQASAEVRTKTTARESSRATIPCNGEMIMAKEQDKFAETIQQQVNSCFEIISAEIDDRRIEYAAASELLRVLNETLALVAPRIPIFGDSIYMDVELQVLRCIALACNRIEVEQQKAGA
jgi:hypothetical protein